MKKVISAVALMTLILSLMCGTTVFAEPIFQDNNLHTPNTYYDGHQADTSNSETSTSDNCDKLSLSQSEAENRTAKSEATENKEQVRPVNLNDIAEAHFETSGMKRNCVGGKSLSPSVRIVMNGEELLEGVNYVLKYNNKEGEPSSEGAYEITAEAIEGSGYFGTLKIGTFYLYPAVGDDAFNGFISLAANSSLLLDAAGESPKHSANVSVYSANGGKNQDWNFTLEADGYYTIYNVANPNLVLDVAGANPRSGANVSVYESNGGLNQKWVIAPNNDGYYTIYNAANPNLVLDAAGANPRSGANVSVYESNGGLNQKWEIRSLSEVYRELDELAKKNADLITDGTYTIYACLDNRPVISVKNQSNAIGATIDLDSSKDIDCQVWEVQHDGDYVLLKNKKSGKYLAVESSIASSGVDVVQDDNLGERNTRWIFVKNNDGSFSIRSALDVNLSLDVYGGNNEAGTKLEIYETNSSDAQKFKLIDTPVEVEPCQPIIDTQKYYFISPLSNGSVNLDIEGASKEERANLEVWNASNTMWQMFRFEYENGYYRIVSAYTDKVLDVDGNSMVPGSNVIMYSSYANADNQLWSVMDNEDGTYSFINKNNGLILQVEDVVSAAGSNVNTDILSTDERKSSQSFKLTEVKNFLPVGLCRFTPVSNTDVSLDVPGASKMENAKIEVWKNNTGFAQKWYVDLVEGKENVYTIQAVCSGKYLSVGANGDVIQTDSTTEDSQWEIRISKGAYVLVNVSTQRVLSVPGASTISGSYVALEEFKDAGTQLWNQISVDPVTNGTYIVRSLVDSDKVIDIEGASTSNNANVVLWNYNQGGNQKYNIVKNSDGTYTFVNCASGKALDVSGANSSVGTKIVQYTKNGNSNQKWYIDYTKDGGFKIMSALNRELLLGSKNESLSNGSQICLVGYNSSKAQHFTFEETTYVPPLPSDQQAMLNRIKGYSSGTQWLIAVDRSTHKVGVFKGSANHWSLQYYWSCTTGVPSTPTITGTYRTTGFKRNALTTDSRAIYCTQIWGGYFFHSILASESELGKSLSHGCIRLPYPAAQWIHRNIYAGTTVVIYN
jgi:hypothetical protein